MEEEELINIDDSPQAKLKLNAYLQNNGKLKKEVDPKYNKIKLSTSQYLHNTSIGKSKYDKNLNFGDLDQQDIEKSINENRAQEQSGFEQLSTIPFRVNTKVATEVLKLAPMAYGVGKAIFEDNETSTLEDIFNNEGIKALDEMNQKINTEYLPVYIKESVKNGSLIDNLKSTSFYATEGADGIGFMASMFVPGMALSKLSLGSKLIGGLSKVSKLTKMVEGTEGSIQVLKGLGWSARNIDSKIAVLTNSMIEAGAESKGTQDALNSERFNEIELYKSKGLSQEEAEEVFNQKHPDWDNQVASAMKGDFWMQMPMLLGTGSMMHKAIFGKALDKVEKTVEYGLKGRLGSIGKQWGKATLSEGFIEEAGQSTLENYYTKKAYEGKLGKGLIGDVNIGDLTKEYINTVSSVEGQKAIFLGALMGGPFMSMEARREYLKGLKDTNSITNGVKSSIDDYNTIKENDIYELNEKGTPVYQRDEKGRFTGKKIINREKALKVAESLKNIEDDDALYDEAIKSDDIELQKFIQNRNILKLIAPAIQNGKLGLQILKEELEQTLKFTDISEADKNSKDENNTNKKLVETILEKAKHLQEQNEKFKDFSPDIIKLEDPRTTKELNEEYLNHLNSKYIETKSLQYDAENNLKELNKKRDNILDELGLDKGLQIEDEIATNKEQSSSLLKQVSDKIRETEKEVSKYKKDINELWENKELINKSFKSYINDKEKKQKQTSEENVQKTDDVTNLLNEKLSETDEFGENTTTREDYEALLNNEVLPEETKAAIRELQKEKVEQLPTQAEKETKRDLNRAEQEGVDEKDIIEDDSIHKEEDEDVANSFANIEVITPKIENNSLGHKIQNFFNNFINFEKQPRDKTKDKVTFSLGDFINNDTVKDIWDNFLKTGKIDKSGIKWLEEYLPIKVTLTNGKEEGSSFLKSKKGSPNFESYELPLRKAIVKALIENKGDFTKFEGSVQGQGKGKLNLDNASTQNNVLDISVLKGMKKPELLKYLKENTYIVNHDKQLVHAGTGQKAVESFFNVIKSFHSGDVFLVFTRPNGQKVPIKLNNKRISEEKAGATVKLLSLLSNVIRTNQSDTILSDKDFKTFLKEKIGEEAYNQLESEINLSKKNNNNERLREILEYVTYSQNNNEISKLYIDNQGNLTVGRLLQKVNEDLQVENNDYDKNLTAIGFRGFEGQNIESLISNELDENAQARFNHLVRFIMYKKTNIIADKFTDDNYIEHVFGIGENKQSLVSTNVSVDKDIFGGYSDIFLNNEVTTLEDGKAKAKELKEIENTEIPLAKEVVYNEPTSTTQSEIEVQKADILQKKKERLANVKPMYHHTNVDTKDFNFNNFQRGNKQVSQFGDGLNASSNTTSFLVSRYGKPIQGEVNDADFVKIDASKTEKEVYEELKKQGYIFSEVHDTNDVLSEVPGAAMELFTDFQKSNPNVKGVRVSNHIIGNTKVAPFYVIYDAKSFYGQGALSKKIEQESNAELAALESKPKINLEAKKADIERRRQEDLEYANFGNRQKEIQEGRENTKKIFDNLKQKYPANTLTGQVLRLLEKLIDINRISTISEKNHQSARGGKANGSAFEGGIILDSEIFDRVLNGEERAVKTFIHELFHQILNTSQFEAHKRGENTDLSSSQIKAWENLERLYEKAKNISNAKSEYGFTNLSEFLAEAFSNQGFQKELSDIKGEGKDTTLFKEILNSLLDFFKESLSKWAKRFNKPIPEINSGLLQDVMYWSEQLLDINKPYTPDLTTKEINAKYDAELKALETENNSENNRIIENNFVSLSKMDKITNIRDKNKMIEFAKENLDFIPKSLKTSENFQQLKQEYPNSEALNKQVDKICGL
jgi:hypothetical protein